MARRIYRKATRRGKSGLGKFLGELELAIMRIAWARSPVTVRQVHKALFTARPLAYTTVMTVMGRLAEKGLLAREKRGRAYVYQVTKGREQLRADLAASITKALIADFGDVAVAQFLKQLENVDPRTLARIRELGKDEGQDV